MATIDLTLSRLLDLVGTLNDSTDKDGASDRFRKYLRANVTLWSDARAYIEEALRQSGDQYNKALQDLINHLGHLLGFEVTYGRYRGVRNQVGFDGLWQSPTGWSVVVETKTTDVYTVRTDTLLGYINTLVSERRVGSSEKTLGLYVYGRFDNQTNQLENAIAVENRRDQLRVVSVPALLSLLELKQQYALAHDAILRLLLPAPIRIDPIVDLIRGVVAQEQEREPYAVSPEPDVTNAKLPVDDPSPAIAPTGTLKLGPSDGAFTGKSVTAAIFRDIRYPVTKWRQAFEKVTQLLVQEDKEGFERVAPALVGRKRPYFSYDPEQLRSAGSIPGTSLYFETNLSAQHLTRLLWTLLEEMGHERTELRFETAEVAE